MTFRTAVSPSEPPSKQAAFARPDLLILGAFLLLLLAVVVPAWILHGPRQGLLAALRVGAWAAAIVGVLFLAVWLLEGGQRTGGRRDGLSRGWGHLGRFLASGSVAAILGAALVGGHGLGPALENRIALAAGLLGGLAGGGLGLGWGAARFWVVFRRFCLALLGSFVLGILGLILPGTWGPDLGILLPILVFIALALGGRVLPPRGASAAPPPASPETP